MADRIAIELDVAPVLAHLDRLLRAAGPEGMAPALREIGEDLVEATKRRFETSTAPDGSRWVPNSEATFLHYLGRSKSNFGKDGRLSGKGAGRAMGKKPLVDSGVLQDTIRYQVEGLDLFVGTNRFSGEWDGGAAVHQFGSRDGRIPARPFLGLDESGIVAVLEVLERHLLSTASQS
ncbi:phage virion morphogenesis protein, putative tail completion [Azoarcus olearius]|uniref:phage virion morphogenesis protein n=1 Tax=Azoarcus sp. (strain BH72) TaxID=418699 RepID=UPI0008061CF5|nr:phage virion morphogenesis protein [Azoarcus olearius]ANQ83696.1 phage virion morphogenesis protein, putative tail completion [Azoarcus olearius]